MEVKVNKFTVNNPEDLFKMIKAVIKELKCDGECDCRKEEVLDEKTIFNNILDSLREKFYCNSMEQLRTVLSVIEEVNIGALFSILLKEIAVLLDKRYPDHISKCNKVYGISLIDGKIQEIDKKCIRSFKNFAAFRTLEDARIACKTLKPLLKQMFCGKQKN